VDEALDGGMTEVVRRGATVVRAAGSWTPTIHALLRHLRARGVDWVPEPLGVDPDGREVLTFLPGDVPAYPLPAAVWEAAVLAAAGRMLRRLHDASAGFAAEAPAWQLPPRLPAEVVCHNDFAPHNLVFRGGLPAAVIDWDTASPGPRAWDLAHLAYRLVPLTAPGHPETLAAPRADRAARLRALCEAYASAGDGPPPGCAPEEVLPVAALRVEELARFTAARAHGPRAAELRGHVALYRGDAAHLRDELGRAGDPAG
jgi:hypothetical protein